MTKKNYPCQDSGYLLQNLDAKQMIVISLAILEASYQRQSDKIADILAALKEINPEDFISLWHILVVQCNGFENALGEFIQIVEANLDGGDCTFPIGFNRCFNDERTFDGQE